MFKKTKDKLNKIHYKDFENGAKEFSYIAYDLADWVVVAGIAIMMSVFLGLIIFKILAVGGLSAVLADLMYSTCASTNIPCEFNSLLGGIGLSLMVVTTFFITTIKLVVKENVLFREELISDFQEPCRNYNDKQIEFLRILQAMNGTTNLRKFSTYMETPYTTTVNYIDLFERDGYIKKHSNGQGTQVNIEVLR